jgi:exonuclease SbcD
MRAIICGDVHIGAIFGLGGPNGSGGNTRVDDYSNSFNYIIDHAINSDADIFIQTGDLFESRNPAPEYIAIANKALKRLSDANIATFVIMGNHDYIRGDGGFTSAISGMAASEYPNVRMILEPEVVTFKNSKNEATNIILLPFRDRKMYSEHGKTCREQSHAYNSEIKKIISSIKNEHPTISIGHNFFYEGSYNDYGGSELMVDPDAFTGTDLAIMGHIHSFSVLRKKPPVCVYSGSMEKTNFGDANIDKYFIDYDILDKKIKFKKTPVRSLIDAVIDITGDDFSTCKESLKTIIESLGVRGKIVRVKISVKEAVMPAIDKIFVKKYLYDNGAHFVSKIIIEPVINRVVRDSEILNHSNDYEMFEAFIESQAFDSGILKSIQKEGRKIIEGK